MLREIISASKRTIFWSAVWIAVLYFAAFIDGIVSATNKVGVASKGDFSDDVANITIFASSVAYSYIGSVGAEATIRGYDERSSGRVGRGIGTYKIIVCLLIAIIMALASAITEIVGEVYNISLLTFSAENLSSIITDGKLIAIFIVCSILRIYIYYGGQETSSHQT